MVMSCQAVGTQTVNNHKQLAQLERTASAPGAALVMPDVSMLYLLWKLSLHHPNNLEGGKRALARDDMILIQGRGICMCMMACVYVREMELNKRVSN